MSLKNALHAGNWVDGNGLITPQPVFGTKRGSDNGPLFTSEYLILQKLLGEPIDQDALDAILACIDSLGCLHRSPGDELQDEPDDYYGVLSMRQLLGLRFKIQLFHKPFEDNQPALLYLCYFWESFFLFWVIPLIILFSNLSNAPGNESNELLTWCLIQGTHRNPLCWLAGKTWFFRKNVPAIFTRYFSPGHPFIDAVKYIYR